MKWFLKAPRPVVSGLVCIGVALVCFAYSVYTAEPHPGKYNTSETSSNLASDIRLMWETKQLNGLSDPTHSPNTHASTDRAINAASRVFNSVELIGKTREEVIVLLGNPTLSSDSIYNVPYASAPVDVLVYRFDCGNYGWQFNLVFEQTGKLNTVERHWIH